jgi:hypothetical protein
VLDEDVWLSRLVELMASASSLLSRIDASLALALPHQLTHTRRDHHSTGAAHH